MRPSMNLLPGNIRQFRTVLGLPGVARRFTGGLNRISLIPGVTTSPPAPQPPVKMLAKIQAHVLFSAHLSPQSAGWRNNDGRGLNNQPSGSHAGPSKLQFAIHTGSVRAASGSGVRAANEGRPARGADLPSLLIC